MSKRLGSLKILGFVLSLLALFSLIGCNPTPAPAPTATPPPADTATPTPAPAVTPTAAAAPAGASDSTLLSPPALREPADGVVFTDLASTASLNLQWDPLKPKLADNEYYLVTIHYMSRGEPATDYVLTQETRWPLASVQELLNQSDDFLFFWSVRLFRLDKMDEQGVPQGTPLSADSPERALVWSVAGIVPATAVPGGATQPAVNPAAPTLSAPPDASEAAPTPIPDDGGDNTGVPVTQPTATPIDEDDGNDNKSSGGNDDNGGDIGYP